jgi:hypothetical protein
LGKEKGFPSIPYSVIKVKLSSSKIGATNVEGIILDLGGKQENTFSWGLGETTCNQIKELAL